MNISRGKVVYGTEPPSGYTTLLFLGFEAEVAALSALAVAFDSSGYVSSLGAGIGDDLARLLLPDIAPVAAKREPRLPTAVWS